MEIKEIPYLLQLVLVSYFLIGPLLVSVYLYLYSYMYRTRIDMSTRMWFKNWSWPSPSSFSVCHLCSLGVTATRTTPGRGDHVCHVRFPALDARRGRIRSWLAAPPHTIVSMRRGWMQLGARCDSFSLHPQYIEIIIPNAHSSDALPLRYQVAEQPWSFHLACFECCVAQEAI